MGLLFAVDEPSFMAGYLAAGMTETGTVCTYGGIKIPPVTQFMVAFEEGVDYYNEQNGADVTLLGWKTDPGSEGGGDGSFTGNFESLDDGRSFAENFFDEGCDIIFPVAGPVGLGSAAAAQDRGFAVIGVDADLTQTNPDAVEVYMTSVLKQIDVAVYQAVMQMADGTFEGGTNLISTLENDGVGLAPYHDWEDRVPAELTAEIEEIRQGIIAGDISTGWPVAEEAPAAEAEEEAAPSDVSIVMSFVPSGDTEEILASGDDLAAMVAERTGYEVESNVATSYAAVIEAMGAGNAQVGWLNTFGYILANEKYGVDVALATERFGSTTYKGQIITRADSGIETIDDLAGTTFCRPDPLSTSGWIIPSITLAAEGLDVENDIEVTDVGSHDNVVSAVYNGDCDAGATYVDARGTIEDDVPDVKEQVVVIRESADIPNDTVSVAADVPADVREAVVNALLDIASTEEGVAALQDLYQIEGLVTVDDTFYDAFRADLDASGYSVEDFQE
jgi:phosphate/phosphite/phosphonate ABC transporter binding protein